MNLGELQERLAAQYARLRQLRATENYPVYAIEHGLGAAERDQAKALLHNELMLSGCPSRNNWLVWIAAAAEVGYTYDGTEYWDTFSKEFPQWHDTPSARNQIRTWYKRFQAIFGGLPPSGPWARQFPIIAWPITQAILPRYLQRHFAEHLIELRSALVRSGELTLEQVGELLCERYYGSSSRFEGFLEQKALTARIVMALRLEGVEGAVSPIDEVILERIVADFDKLGSVGARLRETRQVLRSARFVNSDSSEFSNPSSQGQDATNIERLALPRLSASKNDQDIWQFSLVLPDLATPLKRAEITRKDLDGSRMRFRLSEHGGMWNPGRALLGMGGYTAELLDRLPTTAIALEFENPLKPAIDAIRDRLSFPSQLLRLLKLRNEAQAVEVFGRHVRASRKYLIVTSHDIAGWIVDALSLQKAATSLTSPVWHLDVPRQVDDQKVRALKELGLGYMLGLRVDPTGLPPRWSSAVDAIEFVDGETPQFAISSDIAVREFQVSIDNEFLARVKPSATGTTLFSINDLQHGTYTLRVAAIGVATGADLPSDELMITVRSRSDWIKAVPGKAGLSLQLDPRGSTLDELFEGKAALLAIAPTGRNATLGASFFLANGTVFHTAALGTSSTPISLARTAEYLARLHAAPLLDHLERAARVDLQLNLEEYGSQSLSFEKTAEPLRWTRVDEQTVRLSNDNDADEAVTIECFDLTAIELAKPLTTEVAQVGVGLSGRGGLLVATHNGTRYEAVATTLQSSINDLALLAIPASVSGRPQAEHALESLLQWSDARKMIGPMAFLAKRNAILALEEALQEALCGSKWMQAVRSCSEGGQTLGGLYSRVFSSPGFASGLLKEPSRYLSDRNAAEAEFWRLAGVYKVSDSPSLCRFALLLAFAPREITPAIMPSKNALRDLCGKPIMRGAYFAKLASTLSSPTAEGAV